MSSDLALRSGQQRQDGPGQLVRLGRTCSTAGARGGGRRPRPVLLLLWYAEGWYRFRGPGQSYFSYGMAKVGTGSGAPASLTSLTVCQRWVPVQGPQPVLLLLWYAEGWYRFRGTGQSYFSYGMPKVGTGSGAPASLTSLTVWQRWVPVLGPQPVLLLLRHAKGGYRFRGPSQSYFSYGMPKVGTGSGAPASLISLMVCRRLVPVQGPQPVLFLLRHAKGGYRFRGPSQSYFSYGMPKVGTGSGAPASLISLMVCRRLVPVQGPWPVLFLLRHAKGWFRLVGSGQSYFSYGMPKMGIRSGSLASLILLGMPQVGTVSGALVSLTFLRYAAGGYRFRGSCQSYFFTVCQRWVPFRGPKPV